MKSLLLCISVLFTHCATAQNKYYYQIPDTPAIYTAATVAARMVDGLGFRYYWATEGLTEKDLAYRPSDSARTSLETIQHIEGLANILLNAVNKRSTNFNSPVPNLAFAELREKTLLSIQQASELLKKPGADLAAMDMIFERGINKQEYPFWNLINGPIADALWHVGQVVSFRRATGNPLPAGVSVLRGIKTN